MTNFSVFFNNPANQPFILILLVADLVLRGIALYKSAKKEQKVWFVALLIVNSVGILPLIYILLDKRAQAGKTVAKKSSKKSKR